MMQGATSLLPQSISKPIKIPKRNDERIILHFDYDCFYASVFENEDPSLRSQPLGIKQKSILATCNYVARARGVKKLMLVSEAQRACPDLVLLNGEDLTRFRAASRRLWSFLRAHSWNGRVERLGLDEVFLDVTDVVAYNAELLNPHALADSFFQLDRADPVKGFAFDGSRFCGCVEPPSGQEDDKSSIQEPDCVALMLASHLAGYLRHKLDDDFGYTSSGGVSTNKLLAKLAGSVHKPNNQTILLSTVEGAVQTFMDAHTLRKVPGIGSRTAQAIEEYILSQPTALRDREGSLTVGEARRYPGMSSELLEKILDRPGAERGGGEKVWNLFHGVDPSEVKEASDVPTQISIEDTYMTRPLQTPAEVTRELHALATSLIRRMRVDLTDADTASSVTQHDAAASKAPEACPSPPRTPRWLAYPKTLRLSTRTKPKPGTTTNTNEASGFSRSSRSAPLPSFVFNISATTKRPSTSTSTSTSAPASLSPPSEDLAERLVTESLLPLFRRLHPERRGGWNLALINICVTNMVIVAVDPDSAAAGHGKRTMSGGGGGGAGRDISRMFRTQEDKLRQWTVYDTSACPTIPSQATHSTTPPTPPTTTASASAAAAAPAPAITTPFTIASSIPRTPARVHGGVHGGVRADTNMDQAGLTRGEEKLKLSSTEELLVVAVEQQLQKEKEAKGEEEGYDDYDNDNDTWEEEPDEHQHQQQGGEGEPGSQRCDVCGHVIPSFALAAHERFHAMGE